MKYIAFFDILGFKDIVLNNSHKTLDHIYEELFEGSSIDVTKRWKIVMQQVGIEEDLVEMAIISDSIILWSKDVSQKSFLQLFFFARKLLQNGFYTGMPLRGGFSAGPISSRNTTVGSFTIYGKGLVDAYLLEESQNWSGCVIDETAISCLNETTQDTEAVNLTHLVEQRYLVKHTLKLKGDIVKEFFAINWNAFFNSTFTETRITNSFSLLNKKVDDRTQIIINNTIEFYRKLIDNGA